MWKGLLISGSSALNETRDLCIFARKMQLQRRWRLDLCPWNLCGSAGFSSPSRRLWGPALQSCDEFEVYTFQLSLKDLALLAGEPDRTKWLFIGCLQGLVGTARWRLKVRPTGKTSLSDISVAEAATCPWVYLSRPESPGTRRSSLAPRLTPKRW